MKVINIPFACLALTGVLLGQAGTVTPDPSSNGTNLAGEVQALRDALSQTQKQLAAQQQQIENLKAQSTDSAATTPFDDAASIDGSPGGHVLASETGPNNASPSSLGGKRAAGEGSPQTAQAEKVPTGRFKFDNSILELGGFVDLENIFRTTNTGGNIATPYGSIPYSNTPQGNLTEWRTTAQFSRFDVTFTGNFEGNQIAAYLETDFSGNDASNVYQVVNGHTQRLRLYFVDAKHGKWEMVAGQTWSWLTPNRNGDGPMPVDLALTYNEDQNLGVGVPYTRAAELRVSYHPNKQWAMGIGIEDPNQYIGDYVALPSAFKSVGKQLDNNANVGAANLMPDIISKLTYDKEFSGHHFHAEIAGLLTGAHVTAIPAGSNFYKTRSVIGGGGSFAANYELFPRFVILGNGFWSNGGAHYLVATGPQLALRPNPAGTDISLSMVHAGAGSVGVEWRASQKQALAAYYGLDYFGRNFFPDTTNTMNPGTIIGYGGPGSPNTNNRSIQQATFDWINTFWKNPRHGALQIYTQYSYLTRAPWYVAPGTPKNAHLSMIYAGLRYVLPTTSGTLHLVPRPD